MKSFLVQRIDQDGDHSEWPRFMVLGDRSSILADRMIEYAESISLSGWKSDPCAIETRPFDPDTWLDCRENELYPEEVFVAISGPLDAKDESLLERATKIGARCFIVVDAETSIRRNWQSVVRLPPHRSWDAHWAWGIRVFLDVLLEAAAHRGLICIDPMEILTCINGRLCQLAVFHAEECVLFSSHVMQEVAALCDGIVIVSHGVVVAEGTPEAIRSAAGCADLEEAFVRLAGAGGEA